MSRPASVLADLPSELRIRVLHSRVVVTIVMILFMVGNPSTESQTLEDSYLSDVRTDDAIRCYVDL